MSLLLGLRDAGEFVDGEPLAARLRGDTRRDEGLLGGLRRTRPPGERRAQRLAALGEGGVDDREALWPGRGGGDRLGAAHEGDEAGVDVRGGPEDVAPDAAGALDLRVP